MVNLTSCDGCVDRWRYKTVLRAHQGLLVVVRVSCAQPVVSSARRSKALKEARSS